MSADRESNPHSAGGEAAKRIARNSVIGLVAYVGSSICSLLVVAVLARQLGASQLGAFFTVSIFMVVVELVFDAGLTTVIALRVARRGNDVAPLMSQIAGLLLLTSALAAMVMLLAGAVWCLLQQNMEYWSIFLWGALAVIGMQVQQMCLAVFRGFERFEAEGICKTIQGFGLLALVALLVPLAQRKLEMSVIALALSHVAAAAYVSSAMWRRWPWPAVHLDWATLKDWLREALPLGAGDVTRRFYYNVDQLILSMMQPPVAVSLFGIAYRPLGTLWLVPRAVCQASFPHLARAAGADREAARVAFANSIRILWLLGLPVAAISIALAKPIVHILAGHEFDAAVVALQILALTVLVGYPAVFLRFALVAAGHQHLFTRLAVGALLFKVLLQLPLIAAFGYVGACFGFLASETVFLVYGLAVCYRLELARLAWQSMLCSTVAAGVLFIVLWVVHNENLALQLSGIVIGGVLYLAAGMLLGAFRLEELVLILPQRVRRHLPMVN